MYCNNCGKELIYGAQFCGFCGYRLPSEKKKCFKCLNEYEHEYVFCGNCGTLMQSVPIGINSDFCLLRINGAAYFLGNSPSVVPQAIGVLSFFNDRIDYLPSNNYQQIRNAFNGAGHNGNDSTVSYRYENIASVTDGRRLNIPYFTIRMKDGQDITFSRIGSQISNVLRIIVNHIK